MSKTADDSMFAGGNCSQCSRYGYVGLWISILDIGRCGRVVNTDGLWREREDCRTVV